MYSVHVFIVSYPGHSYFFKHCTLKSESLGCDIVQVVPGSHFQCVKVLVCIVYSIYMHICSYAPQVRSYCDCGCMVCGWYLLEVIDYK